MQLKSIKKCFAKFKITSTIMNRQQLKKYKRKGKSKTSSLKEEGTMSDINKEKAKILLMSNNTTNRISLSISKQIVQSLS